MIDFSKPIDDAANTGEEESNVEKEVLNFPQPCPQCFREGIVKMCQATIPFFKAIIIMAFVCEICGYKSTEIKQGGGISEKGSKITFHVTKPEHCNRDVFKSDSCTVIIPEIDMQLEPGTLGAVYTTVEGFLTKIIDQMEEVNPFSSGDSAQDRGKFLTFIARLKKMAAGEEPFTFVLDDPMANCFIYNPMAPEDDPQIEVEVYERTADQNEELGIDTMVV